MRQEPDLPILQKLIFACKSSFFLKRQIRCWLNICRFKQAWADIDTNGTGYIQKESLSELLRKLTGRFQFKIYDESLSIPNIKNSSIQLKSTAKPIPSDSNHVRYRPEDYEVDIKEINNCLSKMDVSEVRKRRFEYNLYFKVKYIIHMRK